MAILINSLCFVLACGLGRYMQPLLHDSVSWLLDLFSLRKKHFKHFVSSSSVCSLNWLQALLFLLVGFAFFLRFAKLQKPRIKLIVNFKDAVISLCLKATCSLDGFFMKEKQHGNFIPYSTYFSLKLMRKEKGGKNCHRCHFSSAESDFRQMNFGFAFI